MFVGKHCSSTYNVVMLRLAKYTLGGSVPTKVIPGRNSFGEAESTLGRAEKCRKRSIHEKYKN